MRPSYQEQHHEYNPQSEPRTVAWQPKGLRKDTLRLFPGETGANMIAPDYGGDRRFPRCILRLNHFFT